MNTVSKRILYLQYANPGRTATWYSSRILAEEGWDVRFLGVHSDGPQALQHAAHPRIHSEVLPYSEPGWRQKAAYVAFVRRALRLAREWKPDWVYVSDSLAAPAGIILMKYYGLKVVYHEHDSPSLEHRATLFMRMVFAARRALARTVVFNVLPQRERIALFIEETGTRRPVYCVWNCPSRAEAREDFVRRRAAAEALAVYFHGSINLDRVPLALIEGARLCRFPVHLRIVGYETVGSRGTIERLRAAADDRDGNVTLEIVGSVPTREDLHRMMDGMHVGWINYLNTSGDLNMTHLAGASNKAFDYLSAALPIIVPDRPDWENLFVVPGYGRSCDPGDPGAIARALTWFYEHPDAAAEMGMRGRARVAAEWHYEKQFRPIADLLSSSG